MTLMKAVIMDACNYAVIIVSKHADAPCSAALDMLHCMIDQLTEVTTIFTE